MTHCRAPHTIDREGGDCADPTCTAHQHNEDGPEPRRPRMPCGCDAAATEHTCGVQPCCSRPPGCAGCPQADT